jgi:hypothetical protein
MSADTKEEDEMPRAKDNADEEETVLERRAREAAEHAEQHMDDEPGPAVSLRIAKNVRHVFSFKIGAEELDELADAAEARGESVGAFIREAALEKARRLKESGPGDLTLKEIADRMDQLTKAMRRLGR